MILKPLLIPAVAAVAALAAPAALAQTGQTGQPGQNTVGSWHLFSVFNGADIANIIEAGDKVFYLTAGRLYSYDKKSNETYSYSRANKLNDTEITKIFLNPSRNVLLIAYATGNIDMLDVATDRVVNMGDIADATVSGSKTINDVDFGPDGRIYVATGFGLVVFDGEGYYVVESADFGIDVLSVCVVGDKLMISSRHESGVPWVAPLSGRHNSLDKFKIVNGIWGCMNMTACADGKTVMCTDFRTNRLKRMPVSLDRAYPECYPVDTDLTFVQPVTVNADGTLTVVTADAIVTLGADGTETARITLPDGLRNQKLAAAGGASSIWGIDGDGLANYSLADGTLTTLSQKSRPEATTTSRVAWITGVDNRILISNLGDSRFKTIGYTSNDEGLQHAQTSDMLVDGVPRDVAAYGVKHTKPDCEFYQQQAGDTRMYGGVERVLPDPERPDRYYVTNWLEGVYVVENNEIIAQFSVKNMPTYTFWGPKDVGAMGSDINFDPNGNLWVGCWTKGDDSARFSPYCMLTRAKLYGDLSAITASDWQMSAHRGVENGDKDMGSIFSKRTGMMFNYNSVDSSPLTAYDTKKTYDNTADDTAIKLNTLTDQDGKQFAPTRWVCAVEDKRGRIWLGTTSGIIEITEPAKAMQADFRITRLKVPRNDGTIYADYLLESEQVNAIAVDNSDRKWVATENSGVYLVSEKGDAILEHYTAENSDLPSNSVYAVYCDPNSNLVYFGLDGGLVSLSSSSSPAAADYNDIVVYPNPVRPEYGGPIVVKGLRGNSLVKIADAAGNVFFQTRSEGGMVVWDGCNADGSRVRSGVYFVFASQNADGTSDGAVAKFVIVN